jgi:hypothetical protein
VGAEAEEEAAAAMFVPDSARIHALAPSEINGASSLLISDFETTPLLSKSFNTSPGVRSLSVCVGGITYYYELSK